MLKRILANFRLTPSMIVSLLALFIALGTAGYAANGGNFLLGLFNSATQRTALTANFNGNAVELTNTSTGASATALKLTVAAGHPPMKVNTVTKVTNLNADYLDGIDSSGMTRAIRVNYNLAPGALSAPITVPANVPVKLVGVTRGTADNGVGEASLLRLPSQYLEWVGMNSYNHAAITQGASGGFGQVILYIDYRLFVTVEVAGPDTIMIRNSFGSGIQETGTVTLMW
jgi:hypothetical protein